MFLPEDHEDDVVIQDYILPINHLKAAIQLRYTYFQSTISRLQYSSGIHSPNQPSQGYNTAQVYILPINHLKAAIQLGYWCIFCVFHCLIIDSFI